MSLPPERRIGYRPRIWTLIVLIVVAAPVVVANLSHAARPPVQVTWPPPNAAYGWPMIWYWCEFKPNPLAARLGMVARTDAQLVEWSRAGLAVNLVAWFLFAAATVFTSEWFLRRYGPRMGVRPRRLTLVALAISLLLIVLANLSSSGKRTVYGAVIGRRCGWPIIWHWRDGQVFYGGAIEHDQSYSAGWFVANLAMWLLMLGAVGAACEWLLRRYRPRLRWSLRTMLAAVAVVAALCAWCVKLRARANLQDAVISLGGQSVLGDFSLCVEHRGPEWLDLVGAERFRRRIVGAELRDCDGGRTEELLRSLAPLSDLRYLKIDITDAATDFAGLQEMRQVKVLRIDDETYRGEPAWLACFTAAAMLKQLEELHLEGVQDPSSLRHLAGLANLKSLSVGFDCYEPKEPGESRTGSAMSVLAGLPALPRLEALDVRSLEWADGGYTFDDNDVQQLLRQPHLRSLNLGDARVTDAGLAKLSSLESLEELAISGDTVTADRLRALVALPHITVNGCMLKGTRLSTTKRILRWQNRTPWPLAGTCPRRTGRCWMPWKLSRSGASRNMVAAPKTIGSRR